MRTAYQYAKQLLNALQYQDPALNLKVKRQRGGCYAITFTEELVAWLVQYQSKMVDAGVPTEEFSTYEQFKIVRVHRRLLDLLPQYRQIDGVRNIWIVKPSYNARGVGIYCARQLSQIIQDTKHPQQKVVQKYIEGPFFLTGG